MDDIICSDVNKDKEEIGEKLNLVYLKNLLGNIKHNYKYEYNLKEYVKKFMLKTHGTIAGNKMIYVMYYDVVDDRLMENYNNEENIYENTFKELGLKTIGKMYIECELCGNKINFNLLNSIEKLIMNNIIDFRREFECIFRCIIRDKFSDKQELNIKNYVCFI